MKFSNFQNFNPIDLLIEERTFKEISNLKIDYDTRLKSLSLEEAAAIVTPVKSLTNCA